jgi:tol-pal system protein YbgF
MIRWSALTPAVLLAAGGCLASKSDVRLLQDELRATRAQLASGDTTAMRTDESRRDQLARISSAIDRMNDSLRVLAARFSLFQATANGEFDSMGKQLVQVQAFLGQTTRNLQDTRAQLEALREQGSATVAVPPSASTADTSSGRAATGPGPATLFTTAYGQLQQGAYTSARRNLQQLLASYPQFEQAARAQLYIGETYKGEGNTEAADSVYQLVTSKYPKSPEAATGLYRHGRVLWDADKKAEARIVLNRLIREYPNSDEAGLAKDLLNPR